jgi:membrane-bound metal-dependent hydrolase YbcI (DUF457 family)
MNGTTHAIFGVGALAGAALALDVEPALYAYPVAVVAAWLPDVDNPRSTLGNGLSRRKNPIANAVTRPISWMLRTASFTLVRVVGHRTLTHSLLGMATAVAAALAVPTAAWRDALRRYRRILRSSHNIHTNRLGYLQSLPSHRTFTRAKLVSVSVLHLVRFR